MKNRCIVKKILIIVILFSMIKVNVVQANSNNINILSKTNVNKEYAKRWMKDKGATNEFLKLADIYWKHSEEHGGVNPLVAYVQAAKETGYGKFGGIIGAEYKNPCGLKTKNGGADTDPNAHQKFESWEQGIKAHLDHLALYAGATGYPRKQTEDPRHFDFIKGKAITVIDLGGVWAPSKSYGNEILNMYESINQRFNSEMIQELNAKTVIENPVNGSDISINDENIVIGGWALNKFGIREIKVYLDGIFSGNAVLGYERNDIGNQYPQYPNSKVSGYSYKQKIGKERMRRVRDITVQQIGNDGSIDTKNIGVNQIKRKSIVGVDTFKNGEVVGPNKYSLDVSGWALNDSGIKEIRMYLDGKYQGNASIGYKREDIGKVYPEYYESGKSGFKFTFDLSNSKPGEQTISIQQVGKDGSLYTYDCGIEYRKKNAKIGIDTFNNGEIIGPNKYSLDVSGWALNDSGIKEIRMYLDGKYQGNAAIGYKREDIGKAYPEYYESEKSGFRFTFDLTNVKPGGRTISIQYIGKDGSVDTYDCGIEYRRKKAITKIETPIEINKVSGKLDISGWAINDSGIKKVEIYVDNVYKKDANTGYSRPDIGKQYHEYKDSGISGYKTSIDIENKNIIEIMVKATGNDGSEDIQKIIANNKKTIVVDSGHIIGKDVDSGSVSFHNGIKYDEGELNLQLSEKIRKRLEENGYRVIMTSDELKSLKFQSIQESLKKRVDIAEREKADAFISIHHNNYNSSQANGTEVWYSNPKNINTNNSEKISNEMATKLANDISEVAGLNNRGAKNGRLYVTKMTTMPSVLIEVGFLSNWNDARKVANDLIQEKIAKKIVEGIKNVI